MLWGLMYCHNDAVVGTAEGPFHDVGTNKAPFDAVVRTEDGHLILLLGLMTDDEQCNAFVWSDGRTYDDVLTTDEWPCADFQQSLF